MLSLSNLCLGVMKISFYFINNAFSLYDKNQFIGGHEICNFSRPFLCHHYYILSLSDLCPGVEKMIFREIYKFYNILPPKLPPFEMGGMAFHNIFLDVNARRRTPTHSNMSPVQLRRPKNTLFFQIFGILGDIQYHKTLRILLLYKFNFQSSCLKKKEGCPLNKDLKKKK